MVPVFGCSVPSPLVPTAPPPEAPPKTTPGTVDDDRFRLKPEEGTLAVEAPAEVKAGSEAVAKITVTPAKGFSAVEIIVSINYILLKDGARRKKEIVRADIPQMASYSPAVRAGELVFSPGLLPMTRDGAVAGVAQGDTVSVG